MFGQKTDSTVPLLQQERPRRPSLTAAIWLAIFGLGTYVLSAVPARTPDAQVFLPVVDQCSPVATQAGAVHSIQIIGGPPPPPLQHDWVKRVCVPTYEGPHCSNATTWRGVVTLCIDGVSYPGVKLHTRGHVSAMFPKHQFLIKFPKKTAVLGMAAAKKFVLATSFIDTTFQRNPLAFDVYRNIGGWATQIQFTDVIWHGTFYGLFYLGEKITRTPGRLQLPKAHPKKPERSGYLLVVDWPKEDRPSITTTLTNTSFNVYYPSHLSAPQSTYLEATLDRVDATAAGHVEVDLRKVIDVDSFIRLFTLQELARDADGYAFSDFFAIRHGRLYHAAPWDFDLAFNFDCTQIFHTNALTGVVDTSEKGWNVENLRDSMYWIGADGWPGGSYKSFGLNKRQLFLNIWSHGFFRQEFASAWQRFRAGPLADAALVKMVRSRQQEIALSAQRDLDIWQGTERNCAFWYCCHAEDGNSSDVATDHLVSYLLSRAAWIDSNVNNFDM